jgi:hypothetical protein
MKKADVKVGGRYSAKVSDNVVVVRIDAENPHGGWDATNEATGKKVRVKSAQRLRGATGHKVAGAAGGGEVSNPLEAHYRAQKDAAKTDKAAKVAAMRKEVAEKLAKPDPELDKATQDADTKGRQKKAKAKAERKPGCLDAAVRVLQEAGKPLQCGEIVKVALEKGYWQTKGATPAATLYKVAEGVAPFVCQYPFSSAVFTISPHCIGLPASRRTRTAASRAPGLRSPFGLAALGFLPLASGATFASGLAVGPTSAAGAASLAEPAWLGMASASGFDFWTAPLRRWALLMRTFLPVASFVASHPPCGFLPSMRTTTTLSDTLAP